MVSLLESGGCYGDIEVRLWSSHAAIRLSVVVARERERRAIGSTLSVDIGPGEVVPFTANGLRACPPTPPARARVVPSPPNPPG